MLVCYWSSLKTQITTMQSVNLRISESLPNIERTNKRCLGLMVGEFFFFSNLKRWKKKKYDRIVNRKFSMMLIFFVFFECFYSSLFFFDFSQYKFDACSIAIVQWSFYFLSFTQFCLARGDDIYFRQFFFSLFLSHALEYRIKSWYA